MGMLRTCVVSAMAASLLAGAVRADDQAVMNQIREKWNAAATEVKDITIDQEMAMAGPKGEQKAAQLIQRKGDKFRMEMTMAMPPTPEGQPAMPDMKMTTIFDGTDYWMIGPMGTRKMPKQPNRPDVSDMKKLPDDARVVRNEKVGDRNCAVVEFKQEKDSNPTLLWIDPADLALCKTEMKDGRSTMNGLFSDFKKVNERTMPHRVEMTMDGKAMGTIVIKSIKVNSGLADDLFVVKAEAAPSMPGMPGMPSMPSIPFNMPKRK